MNNSNNFLPFEKSYIENILRLNKGKKVTINLQDNKEASGIIEQIGKDNIILSDPKNGKWYLLPTMYINYITFDETINLDKNF